MAGLQVATEGEDSLGTLAEDVGTTERKDAKAGLLAKDALAA